MTIGIYFIRHIESGKTYVGKAVNVERRLIAHKCNLTKSTPNTKHNNRHLYNAVQKYGWGNFETGVLEKFDTINERALSEAELYWIDTLHTTDRSRGFNLRRDSSTKMIVHAETRVLQSAKVGSLNPNYGNKWSEDKKLAMSDIAKKRHASGKHYGDEWKKKLAQCSSEMWKKQPEKMRSAIIKVSKSTTRHKFTQLTKDGKLVRHWDTVLDILTANPTYRRHNIYAVCSGEKPSIYGYVWRKELCQK